MTEEICDYCKRNESIGKILDKNICGICLKFLKLNLTANGYAVKNTYNKIWDAYIEGKRSVTVSVGGDKKYKERFEKRMEWLGLKFKKIAYGKYKVLLK